ncbi:MAG: response regulator [Myxococcota bacterium]
MRPLERKLEEALRERSVGLLTSITLIFGPAYLAWAAFDRLLAPQHAAEFLKVRAAVVLASLLVVLLLRRSGSSRWAFEATFLVLFCLSGGVDFFLWAEGISLLLYGMGNCLIIIALGALPLWPVRWSASIITLALGLGIAAALHRTDVSTEDLITVLFMMVTGAALGLFSAHWRISGVRTAFLAQVREEQLSAELRRAHAEALASVHAKSAFLANVSHEIRTPMNAVLGYASFLDESHLSAEQKEWVQGIESAGQLLLALINDVLDLAKLEQGKVELEHRPFDLDAVWKSTLAMVQGTADKKGLRLISERDPEVPRWLSGDGLRVQQVLLNLLSNAVKFTDAGSVTLRVVLESAEDTRANLRFEVADTGIGMTEEQRQRLFTPYAQADASISRRFGGTGLGLSITKLLCDAMGGQIEVQSGQGRGSTFVWRVRLDREEPKPIEAAPISADLPLDHGLRVLVAEDNLINQRIVSRILTGLGCAVEVADDGVQTLERVASSRFDLVLMDAQMPRMDGLEATRQIRRRPGGMDLCIIALTANANEEYRQACRAAGMDGFLTKPVSREQLRRALVEARDHRSPSAAA